MNTNLNYPGVREALSLEGKWFGGSRSLEEQMLGLELMLAIAAEKGTLLDLGCAEGDIAEEFYKAGSRVIHGCEILIERIETARRLWPVDARPAPIFFTCDLDAFDRFVSVNRMSFLPRYDLVLALSIAHKLERPDMFLWRCARLTGRRLAVRLPNKVIEDARSGGRPLDVPSFLSKRCMRLIAEPKTCRGEWLGIFERVAPAA